MVINIYNNPSDLNMVYLDVLHIKSFSNNLLYFIMSKLFSLVCQSFCATPFTVIKLMENSSEEIVMINMLVLFDRGLLEGSWINCRDALRS